MQENRNPERPTAAAAAPGGELPHIPLIDAPRGPAQLVDGQEERIAHLLECVHGRLPAFLLRWGDSHAKKWLERSETPYAAEIREIARILGRPGCYALNFSFEWLCTTGCAIDAEHPAPRLQRSLDWIFQVGEDVIVARHESRAGDYCNVTWPGYAGIVTAMAPGRFAAAINQAPMSYALGRFSLGLPLDWLVNRRRVARRTALPPSHLLRRVFERCTTYQEAKSALMQTPLCIPAIFTLSGAQEGECCIIERMEEEFALHENQVAAANHWIAPQFHGRPRPGRSRQRRAAMLASMKAPAGDADWLQAPIVNRNTCLIVEMNAGSGELLVRGMRGERAVTQTFLWGALPPSAALPPPPAPQDACRGDIEKTL